MGVLESVSLEPKVDLSPLNSTWEEGTLGLVKDACAEVGGGVFVWRVDYNRTHLFLAQPTQRNLPGVYFLQRMSHFRQYCIWLSVSGGWLCDAGQVTLGLYTPPFIYKTMIYKTELTFTAFLGRLKEMCI